MKWAISRLLGGRGQKLARFLPVQAQPRLAVAAALVTMWATVASAAGEESITRDLKVEVSVNQVGFTCDADKSCVVPGNENQSFRVVRTSDNAAVYRGELAQKSCDFGVSGVGDFSAVRTPGTYYITAGPYRSFPFRIGDNIYDDVLQMIVRYFALQRCGPSTTGYLAPCHVDDGVRLDNGQRQDVSGGWHDASDLRKWVGATLQAMVGLQRLGEMSHAAHRSESNHRRTALGKSLLSEHAGTRRLCHEPRWRRCPAPW